MTNVNDVLRAIRAHCLDCCGGSRTLVQMCMSEDCHLHPYRTVDAVKPEKEIIEGQISMFGEDNKGAGLSKRA